MLAHLQFKLSREERDGVEERVNQRLTRAADKYLSTLSEGDPVDISAYDKVDRFYKIRKRGRRVRFMERSDERCLRLFRMAELACVLVNEFLDNRRYQAYKLEERRQFISEAEKHRDPNYSSFHPTVIDCRKM